MAFKMKGPSLYKNSPLKIDPPKKNVKAAKLRDLPDMPDAYYKYHPAFAFGRGLKKAAKQLIKFPKSAATGLKGLKDLKKSKKKK
jgi:hypothetical protein